MGKSLKRLGDDLDEAERAVSAMMFADRGTYDLSPDSVAFVDYITIMQWRHDAELAYGFAVTEREREKREKFKNRKTPIKTRDAFRLRDRKFEAECRVDEIVAARPEFATLREFIDANATFVTADAIYDLAQERYNSEEQAARRRDAADRASNIVRRRPRRKSSEVHL